MFFFASLSLSTFCLFSLFVLISKSSVIKSHKPFLCGTVQVSDMVAAFLQTQTIYLTTTVTRFKFTGKRTKVHHACTPKCIKGAKDHPRSLVVQSFGVYSLAQDFLSRWARMRSRLERLLYACWEKHGGLGLFLLIFDKSLRINHG